MKHLLFDLETTNLVHNSLQPLHKQPKIIEIFGLILQEGTWEEVATFHSYVDPGVPIPKKVTEITRITDDMVAGKPKFHQIADDWEAFCEQADVIAAHNFSYDKAVLTFEYQRLGRTPKLPEVHVCTVEATEWMKGHRLSLTNLHQELFGEPFANAHSAEDDVRAMARCYVELHKRGDI